MISTSRAIGAGSLGAGSGSRWFAAEARAPLGRRAARTARGIGVLLAVWAASAVAGAAFAEEGDDASPSAPAPSPVATAPERPVADPAPLDGPTVEPMTPSSPRDFSADRAFADLVALSEIGPRVAGTPGAALARDVLRQQLEAMGAEVEEETAVVSAAGREVEITHVIGELPGESTDLVLLVASFDTFPVSDYPYVGSNAAASAPATVLELGRVLASRARPYTVRLVFLDGNALPRRADGGSPAYFGSQQLAERWSQSDTLARVRIALFFGQVADPDLQIARDLRSQRAYREQVWEAAAELGFADAFPDAGLEEPPGPHAAFLDRNLRALVFLTDDRFGGDEPPGIFHRTEQDTPEQCSEESVGIVGRVSALALDRIQSRLVKIDRFVASGRPESSTVVDR